MGRHPRSLRPGTQEQDFPEPQTRGKNRFLRICVRKRSAAGCSLGLELPDARIEILRRDGLVRPAVRRSATGRPAAVPPFRSRELPLPGLSQRRGDREPRGRFHAVPDRGDRQTEIGGQFPRRGGEQHAHARRHSGDGFRLVELRRHHARRVARQRSRSLRRGLFHPPRQGFRRPDQRRYPLVGRSCRNVRAGRDS